MLKLGKLAQSQYCGLQKFLSEALVQKKNSFFLTHRAGLSLGA
jgi:hypothetical protein